MTELRHPDDVAGEKESIADAALRIDAFFEYWKDEIKATILMYPDGGAEALFQNLRELFWSRSPLPKVKPKIVERYDPEDP